MWEEVQRVSVYRIKMHSKLILSSALRNFLKECIIKLQLINFMTCYERDIIMNEGTKRIKAKLKEVGIPCIDSEDANLFIVPIGIEDLGITIRYAISVDNLEEDEYSIYILSSSITRVNNDIELLKLINEINWSSSFTTYAIDNEELKCKVQTFSHLDVIVDDVLSLINLMDSNISNNYSKFMKSNWS